MSADNGIYILKLKDQYRVAHHQSVENVYWSEFGVDLAYAKHHNKLVPT